jgi:hypothetical protein
MGCWRIASSRSKGHGPALVDHPVASPGRSSCAPRTVCTALHALRHDRVNAGQDAVAPFSPRRRVAPSGGGRRPILGLVVGTVLGVVVASALSSLGIDTISIPGGNLILYAVGAGVFGVLAAIVPTIRAARVDILRALTTE